MKKTVKFITLKRKILSLENFERKLERTVRVGVRRRNDSSTCREREREGGSQVVEHGEKNVAA